VPEPLVPLQMPIRVTDANFGRVPRVYVEYARDRAMTHGMQRQMQAAAPCASVVSLDTDRTSFFSRTDEFTAVLLAAAN
jgi:hypothetical protein